MGRKKIVTPDDVRDARRRTLRNANITGGDTVSESDRVRQAAQRQEVSQHVKPRRSARLASSVTVSADGSGTPPSTSSSSRVGRSAARLSTPVRQYRPCRPRHIGLLTPQRRVGRGDPRPRREVVGKVAMLGERCGTSGRSPLMGSNQVIHHVARATKSQEVLMLEAVMGVDQGKLNVDTRLNLVPMDSSLHGAYDAGLWCYLPTMPVLLRLYKALELKQLDGWTGRHPPHQNKSGFIHHELVFPFDGAGMDFHVVPMMSWDVNSHIPIAKKLPNGEYKTVSYVAPFTTPSGKSRLPLVSMHCSPYFVVSKAYWALTVKGAQMPFYVHAEERIVRKIGKILTRRSDDDHADH
ncbi:hypothetical protein HDZ31DRAFT_42095 [Schizophyllum fasciatum]